MGFEIYLRFFVAFAFTMGLIGLIYWLVRRYAGNLAVGRFVGGRRLSVVEVNAIDTRRRLVLVRRDNVEHLVLLGLQSDTVIETGIPAIATDQGNFGTVLREEIAPATRPTGTEES